MNIELTGKVALITGAAGNLGAAMVTAFAAAGAQVVAADRFPEQIAELPAGDHLLAPAYDAMDEAATVALVTAVMARYGRIDALANTIGGFHSGPAAHETDPQTWDFMMNLNARTAFLLSRAALPVMIEQSAGSIFHTSARPALKGAAGMAAYSASKSALSRLVEAMADEVKGHGVRVNAVMPSIIDTPQNRAAMPNADASKWVAPESIAALAVFLASDAARDITGALVPVNGRV
jgi:NAD(P)-dependent dehydrogenase (short-subunit alcohol dehydrogenase family)